MERDGLSRIIRAQRTNAVAGWALIALVLLASVGSFLTGDLLWTVFTLTVAGIAASPALSVRSWWVMPPWEIVLVAALPVLGGLFATTIITGQVSTYLSVAALALLTAVDLDVFTPVEMDDRFAVLFVVVTTQAAAGVWAVVRWIADLFLSTGFIESEHALMGEFTASALAGAVAGLVYVLYRRRSRPESRVPDEVAR